MQYLLSIASELITWMDGFVPSPRITLAVLRKLDYCFASLLVGQDLDTHETLPGFEAGSTSSRRRVGLSRTDMVRCRSIAEQSRVAVVDVFRRGPPDPLDENGRRPGRFRNASDPHAYQLDREGTVGTEASTLQGDDGSARETAAEPTDDDDTTLMDSEEGDYEEDADGDDEDDDDDDDVQMGVARVYEHTLVKLGELLGDQPGGIGGHEPHCMYRDGENDDEY